MDIRQATIEDLGLAYFLTAKFVNTSPYRDLAIGQDTLALVEHLIKDPNSVFLLAEEVGFLAGTSTKFLLGSQLLATEVGWYVDPAARGSGVGGELLTAFENWARTKNCSLVTMISMDEEVGQYYESKGYALHERSYLKELN